MNHYFSWGGTSSQGNLSRTELLRGDLSLAAATSAAALPRLLLLLPGRLPLVVVVVVRLLQLLPLLLVGGELIAGELVEDGVAAGEFVSSCYC